MLPPPSPTVHSFCNTTPSQPDQKIVSAIPPAGINKSGIKAATEITTIYVGNISCNSTPQVISNYFWKFGSIKGISWRKQRAFAFVKFSSVEQAQQAIIGTHGKLLSSRYVSVYMAKSKLRFGEELQTMGTTRMNHVKSFTLLPNTDAMTGLSVSALIVDKDIMSKDKLISWLEMRKISVHKISL
ncbi:organelle RRM domain-containing protein 6, chloroplastic isoform X1 [Tanacetum coccineum]